MGTTFVHLGLSVLAQARHRVWVLSWLVLLSIGSAAWAQFETVLVPEKLQVESARNFFVRWTGDVPFNGAVLTLPEGWRLHRAVALDANRFSRIPLTTHPVSTSPVQYRLEAPSRLRGEHQLVLQVRPGTSTGAFEWTLEPFVVETFGSRLRERALSDLTLVRRGMLEAVSTAAQNQALQLTDALASPLRLEGEDLPQLSGSSSFTIEMWLTTVRLGSTLLSSWDGDPGRAYPLELVVDAQGRLLWYWGRPGRHQSLMTPDPVADGDWHHVAVVHDALNRVCRLVLDGVVADSLHLMTPLPDGAGLPLSLAGRSGNGESAGEGRFVGMVDEMRFWTVARTVTELRQAMRLPLSSGSGMTAFRFDEAFAQGQIESLSTDMLRPTARLAFSYPVRDIRATLEDDIVELSWSTEVVQPQTFEVERSANGRDFEFVGTVHVDALEAEHRTGGQQYRFSDFAVSATSPVWYYRIRQRFEDGSEQTSGVIKLGRGETRQQTALLAGTSPNPFNAMTVISYEVKEAQHISLSVWDVSGQLMDMLVNSPQEVGTYQVRFDAHALPSGIYFARLATSQGMQTLKMTLMK